MVFSGLTLGLLVCHVNLFCLCNIWSIVSCSSPVPPIAVRNCKNIRNRSIRCNSVSSSSSNADRVRKPEYPVISSSDSVTNISKSLKFTPTNSHSIDSSTSSFRIASHRNIHRKRKLRKSVTSSSLVNSANNHDTANKFIVGKAWKLL